MKRKNIKLVIISILFITIGFIVFTDNYYGRLIRWNIPDVYDYQKFPSTAIENPSKPYLIPKRIDMELFSKFQFYKEEYCPTN